MAKKNSNPTLPALAPSELEIMEVVWELGEASINQVLDRVNRRRSSPLRRTTVQVQVTRLEQKGWLTHREDERPFLYAACQGREETRAGIATDLKDRVFGGSCAELVRCLVDQKKLKPAEIERLRKLIDELE